MKRSILGNLLLGFFLVALSINGCGKTIVKPRDKEKEFIGQWTMENRYEDENGDKITERLTLTFYDPEAAEDVGETGQSRRSSSGTYAYRWIYMVLVNGEENESKKYEESGQYIADGVEVQLIPLEGDPKTYQYLIASSGQIDMTLTDQEGNEMIFVYFECTW